VLSGTYLSTAVWCPGERDTVSHRSRSNRDFVSRTSMRISVPTISQTLLSSPSPVPILPSYAIQRIAGFLKPGNVAVLTGAGVSVDSGIRAYRGKDGRYMNVNYKCAPRFHHILTQSNASV
jgi:hypothetical protein